MILEALYQRNLTVNRI